MAELRLEPGMFNDMPYVVVQDPSQSPGPFVIVQHGYTGSLDTEIPYGKRFAELGYTAIVTEADLHGGRKSVSGDTRFAEDFQRTIGEVVESSIRDVRDLLDHLRIDQAGFFGISMGGFIGYRVASEDTRIKVLCPLISLPYSHWADLMEDRERIRSVDPSIHPERLGHCAVLIQNGLADEVVPIHLSRKLYEDLATILPLDRIRMIEYPEVGHEVPEAMVSEALDWMQKHLPLS